MLYALLKAAHLLAVIVWLGGMFFALTALRPAAMALPPPQRVPLMAAALARFFSAVAVAVLVILGSGVGMVALVTRGTYQTGSGLTMPLEWLVMTGLGVVMMLIFGHVRFATFARLRRAVAAQDWPAGAESLAAIRAAVGVNLVIGVVIVLVAMVGSLS